MRAKHLAATVVATTALALGVGACGGSGSDATVTHVTTTVVEQATASGDGHGDRASHRSSSGGGAAQGWTMPDLRGKGLQDAQDAIQALTNDGIFFTSSHDATGQGRHQLLDSDWQVCTQNVAPGSKITPKTHIDFGVVRVDTEDCP